MSVRIILNRQKLEKAGVPMRNEGLNDHFRTILIKFSGGGIFWDGGDILSCMVPDALKRFVVGFSSLDWVAYSTKRLCGLYQYGSAKAVVDNHLTHETLQSLKIWGADIADGQKLFRLIRAGKIWPVENWEKEHKPKILELRFLFSQIWQILCQSVAQKIDRIKSKIKKS